MVVRGIEIEIWFALQLWAMIFFVVLSVLLHMTPPRCKWFCLRKIFVWSVGFSLFLTLLLGFGVLDSGARMVLMPYLVITGLPEVIVLSFHVLGEVQRRVVSARGDRYGGGKALRAGIETHRANEKKAHHPHYE